MNDKFERTKKTIVTIVAYQFFLTYHLNETQKIDVTIMEMIIYAVETLNFSVCKRRQEYMKNYNSILKFAQISQQLFLLLFK